jgi:hypothetical protein
MVATGDVDKGGHRLADILAAGLKEFPQGGDYPLAGVQHDDRFKE